MLANSLALHGMDNLPAPSSNGMLIYLKAKSLHWEPGIYISDQGVWKSVNQISVLTGNLKLILASPLNAPSTFLEITPQELAYLKGVNRDLQTQLGEKANTADINIALDGKADRNSTTQELALKATRAELTQALSLKATTAEVNQALGAKANTQDVNNALSSKVDSLANTQALALKADKSTTYTKTNVDDLLSAKADKSTTYTKSEVDAADLAVKTYAQSLMGAMERTVFFPGTILASSGSGLRWYPPYKIQILSTQGWVGTTPGVLSGNMVWDVLKNGVSIYSTTADRPTIAVGATQSQKTTLATTITLDKTDYLSIKVINASGMDGSLRIDYKPV